MRIRWENIFGLMLLVFSIYLFVKIKPLFENIFESLDRTYYYGSDRLIAILMLALMCLTVLAALKIIFNRRL